jgi:hypothetical protein
MFMSQRAQVVYRLLAEYVRSPSLRHMREERSLAKLALEIVTKLDQDSSVWKKWEGPRDKILGAAIECWIPKADMLDFLNSPLLNQLVAIEVPDLLFSEVTLVGCECRRLAASGWFPNGAHIGYMKVNQVTESVQAGNGRSVGR